MNDFIYGHKILATYSALTEEWGALYSFTLSHIVCPNNCAMRSSVYRYAVYSISNKRIQRIKALAYATLYNTPQRHALTDFDASNDRKVMFSMKICENGHISGIRERPSRKFIDYDDVQGEGSVSAPRKYDVEAPPSLGVLIIRIVSTFSR